MAPRHYAARHRADSKLLTGLAEQTLGKKSIVIAAASGLVAASAGPVYASPGSVGETTNLAADARTVIGAQSLASVPEEAAWSLEVPEVAVVKPEPKTVTPVQNTTRNEARSAARS
ncbi:MAG: hypothetical protein LBK95_16315, partial [Bifidobacteriaceae bacterium]|nr:hypothetical protein [Bifidobacteriaceae bacterium]